MIATPIEEAAVRTAEPRLLVELPSRPGVFFGNLRDLIVRSQLPPLELHSSPDVFWADVLVERPLPWWRFVQSVGLHMAALALLIAGTRFFALRPQVVAKPAFDRSQVIYYQASEYLPPIDTRKAEEAADAEEAKADAEFARQPIISVPPEADNGSQTIVTPPNIKLKREVALPNIVAWSDQAKPQLEIPPVPMTPAAEITRIAPQLKDAVVAPTPDTAQLTSQRNSHTLQNSVVAPPPELAATNAAVFQGPQPALIAPPPAVEASARPLGELNIGPSSVIAPAPQLALAEQRTVSRSGARGVGAPQLVPPPPSLGSSGATAESFGARGRVIALNLHPAVGAPPNPPAGNRRGAFAATPEGHAGASGSPGALSGEGAAGAASGTTGKEMAGGNGKSTSDAPSGLYVGKTAEKTSTVAGDKPDNPVNPNLLASVRPPRVNAPSREAPTGSASKLSAAEREVFGDRKFYSLTLNMPNLNSGGGSWVIRFAELGHNSSPNAPAENLSQPAATRKVDPAYPLQLMRENVSGTVILYAIIHADGTVDSVRVLRGVDDRLDQFASQAIAQWRFQPAMKNGSPVDVEATFQIPFRPTRLGTNF